MTAHTAAQFTPGQVLDAGRRAEAEGRHDFAAQVYRHLADHHPHSQEAGLAREGLARMAPPTRLQSPQSPAMPGSAVPRRPITIAPLDREWHAPPFVPPSARADYRLGRALARVVCWAGGVAAILGLALVPVSILAPDLLAAAPVAVRLAGAATFGFGAAAGGLLLVLLGQLVRALLDQANATRDMAAMVRARADHEAATGTPTRSVRD